MTMRRWGQAGFSMHEVLGAIAGGFILAVVTSGFVSHSAKENALSGAARQVLARVQSARLLALTSHRRQRLVVAGNHLRVERWNGEQGRWGDTADVWDGAASGHTLAAEKEIVFTGDGSAQHYGAITVRDNAGNVRTVRVSRSGHVRID